MSKKRKTKKEKMISQLRRELQLSNPVKEPSQYSLSSIPEKPNIQKTYSSYSSTSVTKNYSYVTHDMKQTFIIVTILGFLNAVLFIAIQIKLLHF